MKLPFYVYIIFSIGCFLVLQSFLSCNTTKTVSAEKMTMIILLEDQLNESYLQKAYAEYNPSDIKKSNRTLNQYRIAFTCTKENQAQLIKTLDDDLKIIKATVADNKEIDIQSGTNDKKSKVKINK